MTSQVVGGAVSQLQVLRVMRLPSPGRNAGDKDRTNEQT